VPVQLSLRLGTFKALTYEEEGDCLAWTSKFSIFQA